MRKQHLLTILLVGIMVVSGCEIKNSETQKNKEQNKSGETNLENQINAPTSTNKNGNGVSGTDNDLTLGKNVMVFGTLNQDGSVSATRIMIGKIEDFNFSTSTRRAPVGDGAQNNGSQTTTQGIENRGETRTSNRPSGQFNRNGGGQIGQNGKTMAGGQEVGGSFKSMTNFIGEIIKKENNSLILKLKDGGSKIVFYTEKTEIFLVQPMKQSETPNEPPPSENN
ncbi:MAG: hypothetical protein WC430_02960 [Patescibacteria group bacterium]